VTTTSDVTSTETFASQWRRWHDQHEAHRADPHGFLAITSLNWLGPKPQRFPDAPGAWRADEAGVSVELEPGDELTLGHDTIRGTHTFGHVVERGGVFPRDRVGAYEVARRGGNDILRPRHPDSQTLLTYHGTPAYEPAPRWAVRGRYVPFQSPRDTTLGSVVEGLRHVYEAPGTLEFALDGRDFALTAFNGKTPGSFLVLFTDATSGLTTYAANRTLTVDAPDASGDVVLDFNRAVNLPCAYTPFATCPLPPAGNHLDLPVEAGEKAPLKREAAGGARPA
jgi:hypothetical protein